MSLTEDALSIYGPTNFLQSELELGFYYHSLFFAKFFNYPGTCIWRHDTHQPITFKMVLPIRSVTIRVPSKNKPPDNSKDSNKLGS